MRKEIDGLRAIAILPVILFHAGIKTFSGGYIGVDVFFVISGYLITSIILEEKNKNNFSIINFYERRARRILPALSSVLLFSTFAAFLLMPADFLKSYSQSLISVTTFVSNIYFYFTTGYFSNLADEKPLLHTWSLAVEEQYYLIFPIMIAVFWSLRRKRLIFLIAASAAASLLLSEFLSSRKPNVNFYLIFSRSWELLFGSLIAFITLNKLSIKKSQRELIGFLGLLMIFYSIFFFDKHTRFPSFYTLFPVIGTCLIIVFSDSNTRVGRFLSNKFFVFIGLISYSLYLWHQPMLAFMWLKNIEKPSIPMLAGIIGLTFALAYVSWKYIETPFRDKKRFSKNYIFKFSIASIITFLIVGLVTNYNNGFAQRFELSNYAATIEISPFRDDCHTGHAENGDYLKPENACRYFGHNITWAVFGDSHTIEPAYALAKQLENYDMGLLHLSFAGCPPALLFDIYNPGCSNWTKEALNYLEMQQNIKNVLLGYRYSEFLFGDIIKSYPELPHKNPANLFTVSYRNLSSEDLQELYFKSFSEVVSRLLNAGKNVYVMYPIPELPVHISKAVHPFSVFGNKPMLDLSKISTVEFYYKRNRFIINKLDSLPYGEALHAIKPLEILCDKEYCHAIMGDKALYSDDNHLSISGATLIAENIISKYKTLTTLTNLSNQTAKIDP